MSPVCSTCGGRLPIVAGPVVFDAGTCTCLPDGPWTIYVCTRHTEDADGKPSISAPGPGNGTCCLAGPWVPITVHRKLTPSTSEDAFKDTIDELHFNLVRAEQHAQQAHDLLYKEDGPKRSVWFKMAIGRAQSILMSLYTQELRRTGRRPKP